MTLPLTMTAAFNAATNTARWEMTQPGYVRLNPGSKVVIGTQGEPFQGLPVDIVPGPRIEWRLLDGDGKVIAEGGV